MRVKILGCYVENFIEGIFDKAFSLTEHFCRQLHPSVEIDGTRKVEKERKRNLGS